MSQGGLWYCLTRYVPGQPATRDSPAQRRRRGRDLARLDLGLRSPGQRTGQRPGWRPQHSAVTASTVIDFGLTRQDSRPYEMAIARTWLAPEAADAVKPVYHAFRLDMAAWELDHSLKTGQYNLAAIERRLSRTGTPPP